MSTFFFFEGSIAAGKSTFVEMLGKYFPNAEIVFEPLDTWKGIKDDKGKNILDYFYSDMSKYAYSFQSTAFLSRVVRMKEAGNSGKEYIFVERSVYSDREIFAKNCKNNGTMTDIEHKLYTEWFGWMEKYFDIPQKYFVYFRSTPDVSYERIRSRARPEEEGVTKEYLETLHELHEDWLTPRNDVLTLDADNDFKDNPETMEKLVSQLRDFIKEKEEEAEQFKVNIHTDGSSRNNPGKGGWGAVIKIGDMTKEISGVAEKATNNVMEMTACIKALEELSSLEKLRGRPGKFEVTINTDSMYVKKGITQWVNNWKKNGWKTANNTPVKNKELWEKLDYLCYINEVEWKWVKAHNGDVDNERADALATGSQ